MRCFGEPSLQLSPAMAVLARDPGASGPHSSYVRRMTSTGKALGIPTSPLSMANFGAPVTRTYANFAGDILRNTRFRTILGGGLPHALPSESFAHRPRELTSGRPAACFALYSLLNESFALFGKHPYYRATFSPKLSLQRSS